MANQNNRDTDSNYDDMTDTGGMTNEYSSDQDMGTGGSAGKDTDTDLDSGF
jgi:hypothetical protein